MATMAFPVKRILPQLEWEHTEFIGDHQGFSGRKVTASSQVSHDSAGESDNSGGMTKTDLRIAARASDGEGLVDSPMRSATDSAIDGHSINSLNQSRLQGKALMKSCWGNRCCRDTGALNEEKRTE